MFNWFHETEWTLKAAGSSEYKALNRGKDTTQTPWDSGTSTVNENVMMKSEVTSTWCVKAKIITKRDNGSRVRSYLLTNMKTDKIATKNERHL